MDTDNPQGTMASNCNMTTDYNARIDVEIECDLDISSRLGRSVLPEQRFCKLHRMHEMQTIVTDDRGVCPSVCLLVCLSVNHAVHLGFTVQKWLNGSRCRLRYTLLEVSGTLY